MSNLVAIRSHLQRRILQRGGTIRSDDLNAMFDEINKSLVDQAAAINQLLASSEDSKLLNDLITNEAMEELQLLRDVQAVKDIVLPSNDLAATDVLSVQPFRSFRNLSYSTGASGITINEGRRLRLDPRFGQLTLPVDAWVERFFHVDVDADRITIPAVTTTVTPVTEQTEGLVAGKVTSGDVDDAFHPDVSRAWTRRVSFPLEEDIDHVEMDFEVAVPSSYADRSNVLTIIPFPQGLVDITEAKYSTSPGTDPTTTFPGFPTDGYQDAGPIRLYFPDVQVSRLKIRLRQRHFIEHRGQKTFYYGLKFVGLALSQFDKTAYGTGLPINAKNGVIWTLDSPPGRTFSTLKYVYSDPAPTDWTTQGINVRIFSDAAMVTDPKWSIGDGLPQSGSPVAIPGSLTRLYALVNLEWKAGLGVSQVMKNLSLGYSVV